MAKVGGYTIANATLTDATNKFIPMRGWAKESRVMFRMLTSWETGEQIKVQQKYIRYENINDLIYLVEKYGKRLRLVKSRFVEVPFEIKIIPKILSWL